MANTPHFETSRDRLSGFRGGRLLSWSSVRALRAGQPGSRRVGRCLAAWLIVALGLLPASFAAEGGDHPPHSVSGTVRTEAEGPISGALITSDTQSAVTDEQGRFTIRLFPGPQPLRVSRAGYQAALYELTVDGKSGEMEIRLSPAVIVSETVTVAAIRAAEATPVTKRNLDAKEIELLSYGQDTPALLETTPSLTWTSDSGTGSNYSYFSLRGIPQNRINITFDGAPLNDPAEHGLFFNNFHDFASAVDSIQIQRGVGTSTVGSPSYGGSVNFASAPLSPERETSVRLGLGSFDTQRASVAFQSGGLANGLAFSGRVSYADTAGYRERSGSEHDTLFFNATWQGARSQLKLVSFSGREQSQLSFLAVEPATLQSDPRFNPLADEERDRFGQDFAQLQYVRELGDVGDGQLLTASLYYNGAQGYFRLWDDPVARTELLQFGIDQSFIGSMVSLSRNRGRLSTTVGVHFNDFDGDHTLDIGGNRIYANTGLKRQANAFVKAGYDVGKWHLFGDTQIRWAEFDYRADLDLGSVNWTFFDPKLGVRYRVSQRTSFYASLGKAEREPARTDLLSGEDNATVQHDLRAVVPESVVDLEAGLDFGSPRLDLHLTLYAMEFKNEIAATGELSEIGLPLRVNVDESYRRGFEADLRWAINDRWTMTHSANLSHNRIREWTQFYDVFDPQGSFIGSEPRIHRGVEPLLTPPAVVNQGIEWARRSTNLALLARWVADSHLDNTGNEDFRAPSYFRLNLRAAHTLESRPALGRPRIALHVDNLLDDAGHYPGGYSYLFVNRDGRDGRDGRDPAARDTIDGIPFFYPLATRNITVTVEFKL